METNSKEHLYNAVLKNLNKLQLLAEKYPNIQAASTELINLKAITELPKGTEHFVSDLHGEYETFNHIMNNASGAIREKVYLLFSSILTDPELSKLTTLIYYPEEKLAQISSFKQNNDEWYKVTLNRLIEVCRLVASKYTRSKVRKALPKDFAYIIEELLHNSCDDPNKSFYYLNIIDTIIEIKRGNAFIIALCNTIKRLVVDHLHVLGDIYDRGSRPDIIMDSLIEHHCVDIQWGNHDAVWMAASSGSPACIATVLSNAISYNNLKFLEEGYGINLRPLAMFAAETYAKSDISAFKLKSTNIYSEDLSSRELVLLSKMYKAITIIKFKLEGQIIKRNPHFNMEDRLLLDKINYQKSTICINNKEYKIKDIDFPTIIKENPYNLTDDENRIIKQLQSAFLHSEKLQRQIKFLYTHGSIYKRFNSNLLLHGCIPIKDDGTLLKFPAGNKHLQGKEFLDYAEDLIREGYSQKGRNEKKVYSEDLLWFLWCGKYSPLFGKDKMATFERLFIDDEETHKERLNPYYNYSKSEKFCTYILSLFGLDTDYSHIINGHIPVKSKDGEQPIRANGKLISIDGGFCRAYQKTTGIAGYTLIFNSYGMKLCSHEPFDGTQKAIRDNSDIISTDVVSEKAIRRIHVLQTDIGKKLLNTIDDLKLLLHAYRTGIIKEDTI